MTHKFLEFGESVEGFDIPVLNEREIRASAGILFFFLLVGFVLAIAQGDLLMVKYFIIVFLVDIAVRVLINPRFAPSLIVGRLIVSRQRPEYVGAPQKRFAWTIGLTLATIMFVLVVVMNSFSVITGLSCLVCIVFLFFETAFGICLGCKLYALRHRGRVQYCPGEVCDPRHREAIQKTSWPQIAVVVAFVGYVVVVATLFHDYFDQPARNLWDLL